MLALEAICWDPGTGFPSVLERERDTFFGAHDDPSRTLVAERDGRLVGYARTVAPTPLPENAHVWTVEGFAVHPAERGHGLAPTLLEAVLAQAAQAGVHKVSLRVLATNPRARRVYERAGFTVEGVLRDEFVLDGVFVDDVLMARRVATEPVPGPTSAGSRTTG